MRNFLSSLWRSVILPVFLLSLLFLPSTALAVVGDVTLMGLPPNTTITLTDEKTGQKEEGKTDERGIVIIPLGGRNWQPGAYRLRVANRQIEVPLTDGNQVVPLGLSFGHSLQFYGGQRWFDGALPLEGSPYMRGEYTAPGFLPDVFSLNPFFNIWAVPDVQIAKHRRYKFFGTVQKSIDNGSMVGFNVGLKHTSNLAKWGLGLGSAAVLGSIKAGVGYTHWDFTMKTHAITISEFTIADSFQSGDGAFRWEIGYGIDSLWPNGFMLGVHTTNGFTNVDIFNGDRKVRADGSIALKIGFRWGGALPEQ